MNELNLYKLFEDIISKSKVMKRFIVAPNYGNELNKNNLGELTDNVLGQITDKVKYPIALLFPPVEIIEDYQDGWSRFLLRMYFLKPQFNDNNGIQSINLQTNTSKHTIQQDWKDMRVCAVDFRESFFTVTNNQLPAKIRDGQAIDKIERVSEVGNDQLAGVGISFEVDVFTGCTISDYSMEDINSISISDEDLHSSHKI